MSRRYVEVALPPPLSRQLTYGVPADLEEEVRPGSLVLVPVLRRLMSGFVLGPAELAADGAPRKEAIRDIVQLLDGDPLLDADIVELCRWMASYYLGPLGSALMLALPPGLQLTSNRLVRLRPGGAPEEEELEARVVRQLEEHGPLTASTLQRRLGREGLERALSRLRRAGRVEIAPVLPRPKVRQRQEPCFRQVASPDQPLPQLPVQARRQAACLELLRESGPLSRRELLTRGFGPAILRGLQQRGLVEAFAREVVRDPLAHIQSDSPDQPLQPTADQQQVLDAVLAALEARRFYPALLHGVTGSGKTLVYIRAAARALEQGRGVIVLVPEIALAWQMVRRFKAHFGQTVAVLHSALSLGERYDTWRRLRRGEQRLVIGARSAVLAPLPDLGLIAVDEEHDAAYKQEDLEGHHPLAYNARDLALVRGRQQQSVVLLGSATPSLESYWNARTGKYHLLTLPRRVDDRPLPRVEVVDMRQEPFQRRQRAIFSQLLRRRMQECLARREQIILLQNRRGFAPFVLCASCGEAVQCDNCRISLTCHHLRQQAQLRCHYCGSHRPLPAACPSCGSAALRLEGVGTQRVERALLEQFPGIRVIRMDVDTTGWKGAHDELVERFRQGGADVLLGTQMVAKGLDFPEVTLVGVISADTGLHMPDFRASERSFQLLTQVAGRSGRGKVPGEVVVQTLLPEAAVLQAAARQDFDSFSGPELQEREQAGFPPFGRLIVFRWWGADEGAVEEVARTGASRLREAAPPEAAVLGPAPAPLARLCGAYRWQTLLRGPETQSLHRCTSRTLPELRAGADRAGVRLLVNVDPMSTM